MALAKDRVFTFGFNSALDIYEKLKRDAEKLERNQRSKDECFNFAVTAWQLYDDWIAKDDSTSALAKIKHHNAKTDMDDMMLALSAVANSTKHMYLWQTIRDKPTFNVLDVIYEDVTNWYEYFYSKFPTIITTKAKYNLWKIKEILIDYFDWVFDDTNPDESLPISIKVKLIECINK